MSPAATPPRTGPDPRPCVHPNPHLTAAWTSDDPDHKARAKRECLACPAWEECLRDACAPGIHVGVMAGFDLASDRERRLARTLLRKLDGKRPL